MKKEGNKTIKSQVTIFIVVGILIVAVFVTLGILNIKKFMAADEKETSRYNLINNQIINCIKQTSDDALLIIGLQGGYNDPPKEYYKLGNSFIPYYYKDKRLLMPSNQKIESEIENYIDENMFYCTDSIYNESMTVSYQKPSSKVSISEGSIKINIDMDYSITFDKNTKNYNIKDSEITINSRLKDILDIARFITLSHKNDSENICVTCVADLAQEKDLYVDSMMFGTTKSTLFIISSKSGDEKYDFMFINKYDNKEEKGL